MLMTQQRMSTGISITIFDHLALALDLFAALAAALVRPERCRQHVNAGKIQHLVAMDVIPNCLLRFAEIGGTWRRIEADGCRFERGDRR